MPFDDEKNQTNITNHEQNVFQDDCKPSEKILSMLSDTNELQKSRTNVADSQERMVLRCDTTVSAPAGNAGDKRGNLSSFLLRQKEKPENPAIISETIVDSSCTPNHPTVSKAIADIGKDIIPASQKLFASQKKQESHADGSSSPADSLAEEAPQTSVSATKDVTRVTETQKTVFFSRNKTEKTETIPQQQTQKKSIIDSIPLFGGWSRKTSKGKGFAAIAAGLAAIMVISGAGYAAVNHKLPSFTGSRSGEQSGASGNSVSAAKKNNTKDPIYGLYLDGKLVQASQSEEELCKSTLSILRPYQELEQNGKLVHVTLASTPEVKIIENAKISTDESTGKNTVQAGDESIQIAENDEAMKQMLFYGDEPQTYVVKAGDTVSEIAEAHGIDMATLMVANPSLLQTTVLQEGQELQVSELSGDLKLTFSRQVLSKEEVTFTTERKETNDVKQGETQIQQEGQMGVAQVTTKYTYNGGEIVDREQLNVTIEQEPVARVVLIGTGTASAPTATSGGGTSNSAASNSGGFIWPCKGTVSSEFGPRWGRNHNGIDIANVTGTPIWASASGTVTQAGDAGDGYGRCVVIDHGNGLRTRYAHNSSVLVSVGQKVTQGQQIAKLGNTGNSTGPHCHFEVLVNGSAKNPRNYL